MHLISDHVLHFRESYTYRLLLFIHCYLWEHTSIFYARPTTCIDYVMYQSYLGTNTINIVNT